jgi:hypothetical protein
MAVTTVIAMSIVNVVFVFALVLMLVRGLRRRHEIRHSERPFRVASCRIGELFSNRRCVGKARMVDVVHGLGKQHRDVLVMQLVHRSAAVAHSADEAEMAQQAKLVRHERLLEADARRKLADRARTIAEACQQPHATRRRESLHRLRD